MLEKCYGLMEAEEIYVKKVMAVFADVDCKDIKAKREMLLETIDVMRNNIASGLLDKEIEGR